MTETKARFTPAELRDIRQRGITYGRFEEGSTLDAVYVQAIEDAEVLARLEKMARTSTILDVRQTLARLRTEVR